MSSSATVTPSVATPSAPSVGTLNVSVLIPAYRASRYITSTLEAVARQSVLPLEVLVFEDGRLDDLAARVTAFAAHAPFRVRLLGEVKNRGVSRARNQLMQTAQGNIFAFLDADDIWEADHLETALAGFKDGADVCFSGVTFIDPEDRPLRGRSEPSAADLAEIATSMFRYNFIQCTSTLSLRREWIARVGDFDHTLSHGEDLDLWLRFLTHGAKFHYTGQCSCRYRKHPASAMANTVHMVERMGAFYEKQLGNPLLPRRERRAALIHNRQVHARLQWRRMPAKSAAAFARLTLLQPWNPLHLAGWAASAIRARFSSLPR